MLLPKGTEIVIASHNQGKVKEINALLSHLSVKVSCAGDYNLPEPIETEDSFEGNALLKAKYVSNATGKIALADDSGLCVNALNGQPGIYSARWAGDDKNFTRAMERIEQEIITSGSEDYSAAFFCALSLVIPEKNIEKTFLGTVKGTLTFPPRGDNGFGYDPIFIADGMDKTFGEIAPDFKHSISHRSDAFRQLVHFMMG